MPEASAEQVQVTDGLRGLFLRNTGANLIRLTSSGILALVLPPFLVRNLSTEAYSTWAILLQIAGYIGFLDFGVQTAVARFVAHADEVGDAGQRDGIISTAFLLLAAAGIVGLLAVGIVGSELPYIFHGMPADLRKSAQIALLLMGSSYAIGLPFNVFHAVFVGLQKAEISAAIQVSNRLALTAILVLLASEKAGLQLMGGAMALVNLVSYGAIFFVWRASEPDLKLSLSPASRVYAGEIIKYSLSLVVWMMATLMISGLDLSIVGIFDYKATGYYAVGITLTNFVVQMQGAIFAALLPTSAVLNARGDADRLGRVLISATRYGALILSTMALPLLIGGRSILKLWVGPEYADHGTLILQILVVGNVIRLWTLPYATLLLGTGQQSKVIASPLAEGVTNLAASVIGVRLWGAVGVAIGTVIGSFVGVGLHILYNIPRTSAIAIDRASLLSSGLLRPLLCVSPFVVFCVFRLMLRTPHELLPIGLTTIVTCWLVWTFGLLNSDRRFLKNLIRSS